MTGGTLTIALSTVVALAGLVVAVATNRQQGARDAGRLNLDVLKASLDAQGDRVTDLETQVSALRAALDDERQARRATGSQLRMALDYVHVLLAHIGASGQTAPNPPTGLELSKW